MINHSKSSTKKNVLHNYNIKKADKIELLKSSKSKLTTGLLNFKKKTSCLINQRKRDWKS